MAVVSGCAAIDSGEEKEAKGPSTPTAVTAVRTITDLVDACFSERGFYPQSDAYNGSGPHPLIVFDEDSRGAMSPVWNTPVQSQELFDIPEPRRYQLIACLGKSREGGEYLGDCTFAGDLKVPQYRGLYDTVVYEAKTGREVGRESIRGKTKVGCGILETVDRTNPKLYSSADLDELLMMLGKFVN